MELSESNAGMFSDRLRLAAKPALTISFITMASISLLVWMIVWAVPAIFSAGFPTLGYMTAGGNAFNDHYFDRFENVGTYSPQGDGYGYLTPVASGLGLVAGLLDPTVSLVIFSIVAVGLSSFLMVRLTKDPNSIMFMMVAFPFLFAISRGNNDIWLLPLTLGFLVAVKRHRTVEASVVVAIMAGLEPLFGALVLPILVLGRVKVILAFAVASALVWLSPLVYGEEDLTLYFRGFGRSLEDYRSGYVIGDGGLLYSNSLWGPLKAVVDQITTALGLELQPALERLLPFYSSLTAIALLVALGFAIWRNSDVFLGSTFVVLSILLFGPVTASYKLIVIVAVLGWLVSNKNASNQFLEWLLFLTVLPKTFAVFMLSSGSLYTLDSLVNPVLMAVSLGIVFSKILLSGTGSVART
jgi:hypothetical protein